MRPSSRIEPESLPAVTVFFLPGDIVLSRLFFRLKQPLFLLSLWRHVCGRPQVTIRTVGKP